MIGVATCASTVGFPGGETYGRNQFIIFSKHFSCCFFLLHFYRYLPKLNPRWQRDIPPEARGKTFSRGWIMLCKVTGATAGPGSHEGEGFGGGPSFS